MIHPTNDMRTRRKYQEDVNAAYAEYKATKTAVWSDYLKKIHEAHLTMCLASIDKEGKI